MRDKSRDETEPPPSTPPTYSVRCVSLALSPLGYDFRCRAARCDSQWDDASFKPAGVGGFRDYSCGVRIEERVLFFPLPISFTSCPFVSHGTMRRACIREGERADRGNNLSRDKYRFQTIFLTCIFFLNVRQNA